MSLLQPLLATPEPPELGPGPRAQIETPDTLRSRISDGLAKSDVAKTRVPLVTALVLLWHDHMDAAHRIVQDDESIDGSYIHAILHRREPDFSNAKYWFRRVGVHPCHASLAENAEKLLSTEPSLKSKLLSGGRWDAFPFVDACEEASLHPNDPTTRTLREIQRAEFEVLLAHLVAR